MDNVGVGLAANNERLGQVEIGLAKLSTRADQSTAQTNDMETAMMRGFNRVDARLEELFGLIKRDEPAS